MSTALEQLGRWLAPASYTTQPSCVWITGIIKEVAFLIVRRLSTVNFDAVVIAVFCAL